MELLSEASTETPHKERWTELRILWDDEAAEFVLEGVGRSTVDGETDRAWDERARSAAGIMLHLTQPSDRRPGHHYLSKVGRRLVLAAAAADPEFDEALQLWERKPQR